jgi:hypothetical protein
MNDKLNLEDLRTEYFQRLEASVPQRAKGIPYGKIIGPFELLYFPLKVGNLRMRKKCL